MSRTDAPAGLVVEDPGALPALDSLAPLPPRRAALLVDPAAFDVVDVKNPFMAGQAGAVDRDRARAEWEGLRDALVLLGLEVTVLPGEEGCEDMVFCANQTLVGPGADGGPVCVPARMRHASRRREVPGVVEHFRREGHRVARVVPEGTCFEGGGDVVWHPTRRLLLGGSGGGRTDRAALAPVAGAFGCPLVALDLVDPRFYHLDTCLVPLDAETACVFAPALAPASLDLLRALFPDLVEVGEEEAVATMSLNAASYPGLGALVPRGGRTVVAAARRKGLDVAEVATGEFLKSGGSVFCMHKAYW